MKKVLILSLIIFILFTTFSIKNVKTEDFRFPAEIIFEINKNYFYINDYKIYFDINKNVKPVVKHGRTFVPLRSIVESIGGEVLWKNKTKEIEIRFKDKLIILTVDKNSAFINGKVKKIDIDDNIKPFILYSRTYIPLRFIIENLGGKVDYNSHDSTIKITIDRDIKEVIDSNGRKVIIPKKIYRIASLYPMSTIIIFSLKEQDKLIGRVTGEKVVNYENIKKIYPNYIKLPEIGSFKDYNVEILISLRPDIVISPHYTNIKKIEEVNLPCILLNHETPDNLLKSIEILGDALDKKNEANKLIEYYKIKKEDIEKKLKGLEKKKVYIAGETILKSFGSDFYQTFMVDIAGGESVTKNIKGGKIEISLEDLLRFNPEYIFIPPYFLGTKEEILNKKELQEIKAIKEKRVYKFPSFILSYDLPSVESILGIIWIAEKINGEILKLDIEKEIRDFYKNIFDYNLNQKEIEEILKD
ncbi:MAG: stalk domain-containing protein [Caldisericia bacterium]|nr:stalk domain-containing protein [Caldisericia bacterium]